MKKGLYSGIFGSFIVFGFLMYIMLCPSEFVILSTNDMHASLDNMSRLATAVKKCRDTVFTIVVDAGDRWTGNAYVDLAEGRLPMIRLMNAVGYDVATLGNHDFDTGQQVLDEAVEKSDFAVVCANMKSEGKWLDDVEESAYIVTPEGVKVDFVGVVTSYANGHPDGNDVNFEGLKFEDPQIVAEREGDESDGDVKVLLSHMGHDRDLALAARYNGYDVILGGHTHRLLDTVVNGTVVGQTQRKLKYVGVTKVKMRGKKVVSIEYENIPLKNYAKDAEVEAQIKEIEANPALKLVVGSMAQSVNHVGLCNLQTKIIKEATKADIGIYHRGGVRIIEGLPKGDVTVKTLFDNEPFFSQVHTALMTPAQLRKLIVEKYNDTVNAKESHVVDLYATTPYKIIVDENDMAYDVEFPLLREGRKYKVAVADYVARNYAHFECEDEVRTPLLVFDLDRAYFEKNSPVRISSTPKQTVVMRKKR
ncbi:MAG: bifunctional metallophosphatase/5'-nucleotidase [Rikenellaceae bacterium]|nr:bifunctional metallophosphatase/5'-nucleotidase [Rikenellaceae bacterium]